MVLEGCVKPTARYNHGISQWFHIGPTNGFLQKRLAIQSEQASTDAKSRFTCNELSFRALPSEWLIMVMVENSDMKDTDITRALGEDKGPENRSIIKGCDWLPDRKHSG